MGDVVPDPVLVIPMRDAIRGAADGLALETNEEVDEFVQRLASVQWSFVRLVGDDFPFWEARKATEDDAAYTRWDASLHVIGQIVETFLNHAERVYVEECAADNADDASDGDD